MGSQTQGGGNKIKMNTTNRRECFRKGTKMITDFKEIPNDKDNNEE